MPSPKNPDLDLTKLFDLAIDQPKMIKQASSQKLKFEENKTRFTHAGFDLYRDKQSEFIWKIETDASTGEEFIIRTASVDPLYRIAQDWSAEADAGKNAITLLYKGNAIKAFKKADLNFNDNNIEDWRSFLLDKVSTDPSFLKSIVEAISNQKRTLLASKCPELFE